MQKLNFWFYYQNAKLAKQDGQSTRTEEQEGRQGGGIKWQPWDSGMRSENSKKGWTWIAEQTYISHTHTHIYIYTLNILYGFTLISRMAPQNGEFLPSKCKGNIRHPRLLLFFLFFHWCRKDGTSTYKTSPSMVVLPCAIMKKNPCHVL